MKCKTDSLCSRTVKSICVRFQYIQINIVFSTIESVVELVSSIVKNSN